MGPVREPAPVQEAEPADALRTEIKRRGRVPATSQAAEEEQGGLAARAAACVPQGAGFASWQQRLLLRQTGR